VQRVEITDSEGRHKEFTNAILVPKITPVEHAELLAAAIGGKSEKFRNYDSSPAHTNLVVFDTTGCWHGADKASLGSYLLAPAVIAELSRTAFREIVVVTELNSQQWVCIALKRHYLLASAYFFDRAITATRPSSPIRKHGSIDLPLFWQSVASPYIAIAARITSRNSSTGILASRSPRIG
jgi:hypothetical protein